MTADVRATAGGAEAAIEDRWFRELTDAVEEYLQVYVQHRDAPKSEQAVLEPKVHEAKADVISRFYAKGWGAVVVTIADASDIALAPDWLLLAGLATLGVILLGYALWSSKNAAPAQETPATAQVPAIPCQVTTGCPFPGLVAVYLVHQDMAREMACWGCHNHGLVYGWAVNAAEWDALLESEVQA